MNKKINEIINQIDKNNFITEGDLNDLKKINDIEILAIFKKISSGEKNAVYLLKCYLTVMDNEKFEMVYQQNKEIVELGLAKLWKEEIKKSTDQDIMEAYIPLTIFDTKILSYFRSGISSYFDDEMFEFDNFFSSLINKITEKKEFVVSRVIFNSLDYTNEVALNLIKKEDENLSYKLERVMDNLILSSKLINFSYVVDRQEQKRLSKILKKDMNENYQHVDMDVIVSFLSYDMLKSLNEDFKLVNNNILLKIIKKFKNNKIKLKNINNVNESFRNTPEIEEFKIDSFEEDFNFELNEDDINLKVEDEEVLNYKKKPKEGNKFKLKYEKKENNIKIILIALFIIGISFFTAFKFISSEIENKNNIYELDNSNKSEVPVSIKKED